MVKIIRILLIIFSLNSAFYSDEPAYSSFRVFDFQLRQGQKLQKILKDGNKIVILWTTYCPECLETLKQIIEHNDKWTQSNIQVILINHNLLKDIPEAVHFNENEKIFSYYDSKGDIAAYFSAENLDFWAGTFVNGELTDILADSHPNPVPILKNFFQNENKEKKKKPIFTQNKNFSISGNFVFRILNLDGNQNPLTGFYGDILDKGLYHDYLFEPELKYNINAKIKLYCKFRISNIKKDYLFGSPDYAVNEYFSPALIYHAHPRIKIRAGYYQLSLSPFTLYRWDKENNPGFLTGSGSCGSCTGAAGSYSSKNLELMNKHYGFEGFTSEWLISNNHFFQTFFARPKIKNEYCSQYNEELWGIKWFSKGINFFYIYNHENPGDCKNINYIPQLNPYGESHLASISLKKNFHKIKIGFEHGHYFQRTNHIKPVKAAENHIGCSDMIFLQLPFPILYEKLKLQHHLAYYIIDKNYQPFYMENSYQPNTKNFRLMTSFQIQSIHFTQFYKISRKKNKTLNAPALPEEKETILFGLNHHKKFFKRQTDFDFFYLYENSKDQEPILKLKKSVFNIAFTVEAEKNLNFRLEYRKQKTKTTNSGLLKETLFIESLSFFLISSF